ncbi:MAG: zinc ribbon domain-containing protein [Planctomycetota bacterium]|jgi:cell shape-determining protein MreC
MSPIGRLFIVLNLVLAGVFVGFAGTYLQKASTWKESHDELKSSSDAEIASLTNQLESRQKDINDLNVRFTAADTKANQATVTIEDLTKENERLNNQLSSIEGDIKTFVANHSTVASSVDRATTEATAARQASIDAATARDAAVREKDVAVADLRDANTEIETLKTNMEALNARVQAAEDEARQTKALLEVAVSQGFKVASAQPAMGGTVTHVGPQGTLLTIAISDNPAKAEVKPGLRFSIMEGADYKGTATITDVDGSNALCRMTNLEGASVKVGDAASTKLAGRR